MKLFFEFFFDFNILFKCFQFSWKVFSWQFLLILEFSNTKLMGFRIIIIDRWKHTYMIAAEVCVHETRGHAVVNE